MTQENKQINPGEDENRKNMGLPEKDETATGINQNTSLPSDGPVGQNEGSEATDLTATLENDDPKDIREDAETGS
ncbi:hypothetical protein SRABI27_03510 [Pedobacter sp. Bi27]|uniref:hypothetical protein n=1 Tax=unclassified Pedobacter TaxID=2628915 RepID=UPI001DB4B4FF|nr:MULTISPECIES: hypothetical protein [unclassified Pedobacter]CAH0158238.1 hypothetical protein SRABI36_00969 [Pedobacter sp. Bi36]CAH0214578.1 hypothetical protein SRABI126_02060 [Pedobacter sp. Bi126]CAH0271587.1 hypothetical protein SRABI27_03510 [Pedobacter sp. Bi27]